MDLSLMLMIGGCVAVAIALVFCFFGYRLARLLLPICGVIVFEVALYVFVYDMLGLNGLNTWLFFCGSSIAIYVLLFLFKRIAGFFAGALGAGLLAIYAVYAIDLSGVAIATPACLTICAVAGLFTVVYKKIGVVLFTSLFGACVAAYIGSYLLFNGINLADLTMYGNVLVPLEQHLDANAYIVIAASLGLAVTGFLIQVFASASRQVLSGIFDDDARLKKRRKAASGESFGSDGSKTRTKAKGRWDEGI